MTDSGNKARAERLQQARRFLEAGRTHIDPGSRIGEPAAIGAGEIPGGDTKDNNSGAGNSTGNDAGTVRKGDAVETQTDKPDPTRFGDWEKNGRCIDF